MAYVLNTYKQAYVGTQDDSKPTGVKEGSTLYECDTDNDTVAKYVSYDGTNWTKVSTLDANIAASLGTAKYITT